MPSTYTPQQKAKIQQFTAVTSATDRSATKFLKAQDWNVQRAADALWTPTRMMAPHISTDQATDQDAPHTTPDLDILEGAGNSPKVNDSPEPEDEDATSAVADDVFRPQDEVRRLRSRAIFRIQEHYERRAGRVRRSARLRRQADPPSGEVSDKTSSISSLENTRAVEEASKISEIRDFAFQRSSSLAHIGQQGEQEAGRPPSSDATISSTQATSSALRDPYLAANASTGLPESDTVSGLESPSPTSTRSPTAVNPAVVEEEHGAQSMVRTPSRRGWDSPRPMSMLLGHTHGSVRGDDGPTCAADRTESSDGCRSTLSRSEAIPTITLNPPSPETEAEQDCLANMYAAQQGHPPRRLVASPAAFTPAAFTPAAPPSSPRPLQMKLSTPATMNMDTAMEEIDMTESVSNAATAPNLSMLPPPPPLPPPPRPRHSSLARAANPCERSSSSRDPSWPTPCDEKHLISDPMGLVELLGLEDGPKHDDVRALKRVFGRPEMSDNELQAQLHAETALIKASVMAMDQFRAMFRRRLEEQARDLRHAISTVKETREQPTMEEADEHIKHGTSPDIFGRDIQTDNDKRLAKATDEEKRRMAVKIAITQPLYKSSKGKDVELYSLLGYGSAHECAQGITRDPALRDKILQYQISNYIIAETPPLVGKPVNFGPSTVCDEPHDLVISSGTSRKRHKASEDEPAARPTEIDDAPMPESDRLGEAHTFPQAEHLCIEEYLNQASFSASEAEPTTELLSPAWRPRRTRSASRWPSPSRDIETKEVHLPAPGFPIRSTRDPPTDSDWPTTDSSEGFLDDLDYEDEKRSLKREMGDEDMTDSEMARRLVEEGYSDSPDSLSDPETSSSGSDDEDELDESLPKRLYLRPPRPPSGIRAPNTSPERPLGATGSSDFVMDDPGESSSRISTPTPPRRGDGSYTYDHEDAQRQACTAGITLFEHMETRREMRRDQIANLESVDGRYFRGSGTSAPSSGLSTSQLAGLNKLFDSYRDAPSDNPDTIGIEGAMKYMQDLSVQLDDIAVLAVGELLQAPSMGEFVREGFVNGWKSVKIDTLSKQQSYLHSFRPTIATTPALFRRIYRHTFTLARSSPSQKTIPLDTALEYWRLLFSPKRGGMSWTTANTPWFDWWVEYLEKEWKRGVNRDMWMMTLEFSIKSLEDDTMGWWDEEGAWPGVVDGFVAFVKAKREGEGKMDVE